MVDNDIYHKVGVFMTILDKKYPKYLEPYSRPVHEYVTCGPLSTSCWQIQNNLISGSEDAFNRVQYGENVHCYYGMLEYSRVEHREETKSEKEKAKERAWMADDSGGFGGHPGLNTYGDPDDPGEFPYVYYCPQAGCDQKKGSFSIMAPPPTCEREICARYRKEMKLRA